MTQNDALTAVSYTSIDGEFNSASIEPRYFSDLSKKIYIDIAIDVSLLHFDYQQHYSPIGDRRGLALQ